MRFKTGTSGDASRVTFLDGERSNPTEGIGVEDHLWPGQRRDPPAGNSPCVERLDLSCIALVTALGEVGEDRLYLIVAITTGGRKCGSS